MEGEFEGASGGPLVVPGTYRVTLARRVDGVVTPLGEPQTFTVESVSAAVQTAPERAATLAFEQKVERLQRAVLGAQKAMEEAEQRLDLIDKALVDTPAADPQLATQSLHLRNRLRDLETAMTGDKVVAAHQEPVPPAILQRLGTSISWGNMVAPTHTQEDAYQFAAQAFAPTLDALRQLIEVDLKHLEDQLEAAGAPWTPGRLPRWHPE